MADEMERLPVMPNPMVILDKLVSAGAEPEKLDAVIKLVENWNRNRAIEAFAVDMNACQAEMPAVVEDAQNTHTKSRYALLETVQRIAKPVYTKHGFSLSWSEGEIQPNGMHRIIMLVRHRGGYVETHFGNYPIDGTGAKGGSVMNPLQGTVSAHTYAQRDMMRGLFNLVIAGDDKDGNDCGLSPGQIETLNNLLEKIEANSPDKGKYETWVKGFWKWLECPERMHDLSARDYEKAKAELERVIKKGTKGQST